METEPINENLKHLEEQNKALMSELFNLKSKPKGRIGYIFLGIGFLLFALAIDYSNYFISFLSLALIFWGGLFLYVKPTNFVRQEILLSTLLDTYSFYNQILESIDYTGIPNYFSPKSLSDFKEVYLIIPKNKDDKIKYENITSTTRRSNYFQMTPLGLGISKLMEEEAKQDFSTIGLDRLFNLFEKILIEDLEMVKEFEYLLDGSDIQIKIVESIFDSIYGNSLENEDRYATHYITSAIACSVAKTTHRPIIINKFTREENRKVITAHFKIL
ncbi:MAG: hypothetical protein KGD74_06865 [Candidatus Lokiarchaeota archaeon]|nr:hypothetical protein [Candidatus Lokiarchaeota archaeon]